MKLEELRELILLMRENQIAEIDLEEEGKRVRVVAQQAPPVAVAAPIALAAPLLAPAALPPPPPPEPDPGPPEPTGVEVKSPLVGTFYRAAMPETPPFADIGTEVEEESILCIVEAMKVMNEIKAEMKGRILKVLVENGHPVEFGQPLFLVAPI